MALKINSRSTLDLVLTRFGLDITLFGKGTNKSIDQLYNEIVNKETELTIMDDQLYRNIKVVSIILKRTDDGRYLRSGLQIFHPIEGRESYSRSREQFIAEKLYTNENLDNAICRGLTEEIGIIGRFPFKSHPFTEVKLLESYPGLRTIYHVYNVIIEIDVDDYLTIINDEFQYTEYFKDGSPRLTTHWHWLQLDDFADQLSPLLLNILKYNL